MSLVRGPFNVKWGNNLLKGIQEISLDYSQDSNDYTTIQGQTYRVDQAISASVTLQFLETDVASLAAVIPQYLVANGEQMSSGETVNDPAGALDVLAASCDTDPVYNDLDVISCGNPGQVFRLKNARTKIDTMEFADSSVRVVSIQFLGEPDAGVGTIQFFKQGTLSSIS